MTELQILQRAQSAQGRELAALRLAVAKSPLRPARGGSGGGKIYKVATFGDLPDPASVGDAALGYTEDKDNFYGVRDGAWRILHAFSQATAPSGIGEADGDVWVKTDDNSLYFRSGGAWVLKPEYGTAVASIGAANAPGSSNKVAREDHVHGTQHVTVNGGKLYYYTGGSGTGTTLLVSHTS